LNSLEAQTILLDSGSNRVHIPHLLFCQINIKTQVYVYKIEVVLVWLTPKQNNNVEEKRLKYTGINISLICNFQ